MLIYKSIEELKAEHRELIEQLEQLNKERLGSLTDVFNYINKTKEMHRKIVSMTCCEYELSKLIGSEAPITAPFMYQKYGISPNDSLL